MATETNKESQVNLAQVIADAIRESRKPYVDPDLEKRKQRDRARLQQQREQSEADKEAAESACNHLREDGSSRIAWQTLHVRAENNYQTNGVCQYCNKYFDKTVDDFDRLVKIPTRSRGF